MAKLTLDLSGKGGLVERYQGDLNDTSSQPQLRYLGQDGQMAEGIYNSFKEYGYLNPANDVYATLTGTVSAAINSIQYDAENDNVYLSEEGENVLTLSSLSDTSLSNYFSVSSGSTIKDMVLYEISQSKALIFALDSGNTTDGMSLGFKILDSTNALDTLEKDVVTESSQTNNWQIVTAGDEATLKFRKYCQSFNADDCSSLFASGFELALEWDDIATPSGVTVQVSIQANSDRDSGVYSYQGTWADATAYSVNDTVTYNSVDYACISAHTSTEATDRPSTGSNWENIWTVFRGAPDGTAIRSATVTADELPEDTGSGISNYTRFDFASSFKMTAGEQYWIVVEESGSNLATNEFIEVIGSVNNQGIYSTEIMMGYVTGATDYWDNINLNKNQYETMHFTVYTDYAEDWSSTSATGSFAETTGQDSSLFVADNALLYWQVGRDIHTADGGGTGGALGRVNQNVLAFPSYINIVDIAETRSRMYFGVQTSDKTTSSDGRTFPANKIGIYVWNRRSQILGGSDFYAAPGAREIKKVFLSSDGSVKAITIGNSGFTEIRGISGNQFAVIHTLEKNAYPSSKRGLSQVDQLSMWLGANGLWYAFGSIVPGEPQRLYKIGDMTGEANSGLVTGPILIGHEEASEPRMSVVFGWEDSDPSYIVQKWYPNGDGTINSVAQTGNSGNVYTQAIPLPPLSNIRYIYIMGAPTSTDNTDDIVNVKIYFNQSTTPWATKNITKADMNKGYFEIPVNKQNINFVQVEIEWPTDETLGADTFRPSFAVVDYDPVETSAGKTT